MGTSLTGNNISQSYLGLIKSTDSQALGSTAKRLTDGAGNDTSLYLSTSRLGIGVASPSRVLDVDGDIEVNSIRIGKGGGSISTNTVLGQNAINNSSNTGAGNVAIGFSTLILNTSGSSNVGVGITALSSNTTGGDNVAVGADALENNSTGSFNVAVGHEALVSLNSGEHNVAIGNDAGTVIETGSQSIIIGSQADASDVTSQNEIVIGYNTTGNGSNTVTIGNSSITANHFSGNILLGDNSKAVFGNDSDLQIYHDNVNSYIADAGAGSLRILVDDLRIRNAANNAAVITGIDGGSVFLYHNGNEKIKTISTGIDVTGSATISSDLILSDYGSGTHTGTATQRLGVDSSGNVIEIPIGGGAVDGSGTANTVTMWSDTDTITDAPITISGNNSTFTGQVIASSSSSGDYVRMYGGSGTGKWDIYGSGTDLRFTDNESAGNIKFDTNVGIGVSVPSDAHSTWSQLFLGEKGSLISEKSNTGGIYGMYLTDNLYLDNDTGNFAYITTDEASAYRQEAGQHQFFTVASGTAGGAAGLSQKMILDSSGRLGIGLTPTTVNLEVKSIQDSSFDEGIGVVRSNSSQTGYINMVGGAMNINAPNAIPIKFRDGGNTNLTIGGDGNATFAGNRVFIENSTSPQLRVTDTTNTVTTKVMSDDSNGYVGTHTDHNFSILRNNSVQATFTSTGLGLGTSSPSALFHVAGSSPIIQTQDTDGTNQIGRMYQLNSDLVFSSRNNTSRGSFSFQSSNGTDTVERMVIDSSGRLGLGTSSPQTYLQIGDYPSNNIDITTYPNVPSEHMIHLSAPETTNSYGAGISFGENSFTGANITVQDAGGNGSLHMLFGTRDTSGIVQERLRITSGGDLLIGKTGNNIAGVGIELRENGLITASRDAGTPLIANREGTVKGNMIDLRQDNSPILTIGTSGDNVFIAGTTNVSDLLLRSNGLNRIRIHDYGLTSFDTYGSINQTSTDRLHHFQIFTMDCTSASSGTAKAMANVGNTNSFDYTIIARIDASNIGSIAGRTATANGTNSGFFSRTAYSGNVTAITPTYNATSDTLEVAVTYTGATAPTVHITINGVSEVDMSRTGGCST